jgi:polyisoprenoid-binding protein YceI
VSLDTSISELKWKGKEITTKEHYGSLVFKSRYLTLKNNKPIGGKFVVDMTSLKNEDLPADYCGKLKEHLKSDDFFLVNKFPEAYFEIKKSTKKSDANFDVNEELTIKGITYPVSFSLVWLKMINNGKQI